MKNKILYLFSVLFTASYLFFNFALYAQEPALPAQAEKPDRRGVWVSCFSERRVLYSKQAALELVEFCRKAKIGEIYLQFYRSSQAYYDSRVSDRTKYDEALKAAGEDVIDILLKEAVKNNIKVFAWINTLSLSQNKNAHIISKFGEGVLTRDQYLRPSMRGEKVNESDNYYLRDEQLFLEPGEAKVGEYLLAVVNEIVERYPAISGIHLDYLRYPQAIPYLPDSRFNKYGLSYGYGEASLSGFKEATGLNPLTMRDENDNYLRWDNWKREQLTALVEEIAKQVKKKNPALLVSCAVFASCDRAYSVVFQDWPLWLEKGIIDYVVLMNYTKDNRWAQELTKSALAHRGQGSILVGMGVFMMKDNPQLFQEQYKILSDLKPDGIVFFSYDDLIREGPIANTILDSE